MDRDVLLMRAASLIADKFWITAQANLEMIEYKGWPTDWSEAMGKVDAELATTLAQLEPRP